MILTKTVTMGIRDRVMRLRVSTLEKWESLSMNRTYNPSMSARTYNILGLTIGAAIEGITRSPLP